MIKAVIDYGDITEQYASLTHLNERLGLIKRVVNGLEATVEKFDDNPLLQGSTTEDREYIEKNREIYQLSMPNLLNKASSLSRMIDEYRESAPIPVVEAIDGKLAQIQNYCNELFKPTGVSLL